MDIVSGIGDSLKKGAESVGNALGNAVNGNKQNDAEKPASGEGASKNPLEKGMDLARQTVDNTISGAEEIAESASKTFNTDDTTNMSDEAREEKAKDDVGANIGEIVSTIKNIATAAGKGGRFGRAGGVGMFIDMTMSSIANDGKICIKDVLPSWMKLDEKSEMLYEA